MRIVVGGTAPDLTASRLEERDRVGSMSGDDGTSVDPAQEERELAIPGENKKLDTEEDVADTVQAIRESEGLISLRLSGNSMGVRAAQAIAKALSSRPTLRRALWSDMFVSRLKSEIPPALMALGDALISAQAQLVELNLSDNAFGPAGVEAISALLTSPVCFSLRTLKLNNTGMGITGGKLLSKALLQCYEEAGSSGGRLQLEVFVAGRNRLENEGAAALAEVFETVGTLVEVSMPQNGIHPPGISSLAKAFAKNLQLKSIDLNDNTFTEEGSDAMATVLPTLQQLTHINFGDCLVRPGGARAIASAIQDGHKLLEEVNLGFNELDQISALAVAEAMANKTELKKLDLNGNSLGEEGMELLRLSLEAKGKLDALGSLSEDEGAESEEEEEEGEEEEEEEEKEVGGEHGAEEANRTAAVEQVSLAQYLAEPSADNLLALGEGRADMVTASLGSTWSAEDAARLYVKVASCYYDNSSSEVKRAVGETLDKLVQPVCEAGHTSQLLNEILVQIGLIKSEDKLFRPVKDVEGPTLALTHLVRQSYFPQQYRDILITFIQKPNSILDATRPRVLQVLYTS